MAELHTLLNSLVRALAKSRSLYDTASVALIDNSEEQELNLDSFIDVGQDLNELSCELRLVQGQGNVGYGAGHNLVLNNSSSSINLILNPDVELNEDSLLQGLKYLQQNPDVVAVSPNTRSANGDKQYLCKRYPSVFDFFLRGFTPGFVRRLFSKRLASFEMQDLSEDSPDKSIPIISGCFMLCRGDALRGVGGFDESYFLYFEDFDLSLRLRKLGALAYLPSMMIIHHGGHSARKGMTHIRLFIRSAKQFFSTNGWRIF